MEKEKQLLQTQILTLLRNDRERGAELLLETYTPLLWSVCQRRLSNPEDIKECINDVFADFCMNLEKYDPQQTSLKNYLSMLADRRAISYYRKNQRRTEAENSAAVAADAVQDDKTLELEEALNKLKPEDAQIIRHKYYDGMTYREIAQHMGLSEDAVKKRGARSLSKLAKWFIIGLLLASILAGCAYVVHRYFRYSKGVGVTWDSEAPTYQLMEMPEPITANGVTRHLLSASYSEETLTLWVAHYPSDDTMTKELYNYLVRLYEITVDGGNGLSRSIDNQYSTDIMSHYTIPMTWETVTADENGRLHLQVYLTPGEEELEEAAKSFGYDAERTMYTWDITLEETEILQDPADLGYYLRTTYADILVMTDWEYSPETEDSIMMISLYPEYKEEGLKLSERVSTWYELLKGFDPEPITLTDAAGNSYPVFRTISPSTSSAVSAYTLCFQNVPPGEYTLNIPSLCYQRESEACSFTLSLPKEDNVPLPCDETVYLPKNTTVHITGVTRNTISESGTFLVESFEDGVQVWTLVEDTETQWHYELDYQVTADACFPLCGAFVDWDFCYITESGITPIVRNSQMTGYANGLNKMVLGIRDGLGMDAPDVLMITIEMPYYMDVQSYSIPITIK